jgi:salicylate hydroxylase
MTNLTLLHQVIVVGAGLGGLGAAIAILLAGHSVTVLESASEIAEVLLLSPF